MCARETLALSVDSIIDIRGFLSRRSDSLVLGSSLSCSLSEPTDPTAVSTADETALSPASSCFPPAVSGPHKRRSLGHTSYSLRNYSAQPTATTATDPAESSAT